MERSSDNKQTAVIEQVGFIDRCKYMVKFPIYRWATFHHVPPHIMNELLKKGEYFLRKGEEYVIYDFRYQYYKRKGVKVPSFQIIKDGMYLKLTEEGNDIEVYAANGFGCRKELSKKIKCKGNINKYHNEQIKQKQTKDCCKMKNTLRESLPYMGIPFFCKENDGLIACDILLAIAVFCVRMAVVSAPI